MPGPEAAKHTPGLPHDSAVGVRGHRGGLFVTTVNGAEPDLDTAGRDVHHRTAGEIKDGVHPFVFERFDNERVAIDLGHDGVLLLLLQLALKRPRCPRRSEARPAPAAALEPP